MTKLTKLLRFFRQGETCEIKIELTDNRLSICGLIYSGRKLRQDDSNLLHVGQCKKEAKKFITAQLYEVWDRWHLNDMRAGTPAQTELVKEFLATCPGADYDEQCIFLSNHGLLVDGDYRYGSAWLKEDLPQEVIDYVHSL